MSIPDYETLMLPLLRIAGEADGQEVSLVSAVEILADQFKLSESDRRELLPSGGNLQVLIPCVLGSNLLAEGRVT